MSAYGVSPHCANNSDIFLVGEYSGNIVPPKKANLSTKETYSDSYLAIENMLLYISELSAYLNDSQSQSSNK